jgi:nucleoid-associated protein YgaU
LKLPVTSGAVAVLAIIFGIPCLWAQNLGDIARQDRERRSRLSSHSPILTNDDLVRERILTPELIYRILTTQGDPGATAVSPPAPQRAEEQVPPSPVTVDMVRKIRSSAAHQPPSLEAIQPAAVAAQTLPARTLAYTEPAVAATAAIDEPVSLGEYARHLRAYRATDVNVPTPDVSPAETAVAATAVAAKEDDGISLGEYARQLRSHRTTNVDPQTPDVSTAETAVASHDDNEISLGEYARQLQSRRVAEPLVARGPAASETPADAGQPVSLGEYARHLRALRSIQTSESASIAPLPPRTEVRVLQPEIALGEYARQFRIRRAAEEYARLLAQDDTSFAAALTGDATPPIRYHEIRPGAAAQSQRQRRVVAARNNPGPAPERHIAVTVRRGDSLWRLARTYLRSGARWQSISFLNRHPGSPHLIRAGEVVLIPVVGPQRARASAVASRRPGNPIR